MPPVLLTHTRNGSRSQRRLPLVALGMLVAAIALPGGSAAASSESHGNRSAAVSRVAARLVLRPAAGPAGTLVHAVATGLPPGEHVRVLWTSTAGKWITRDGNFFGRKYSQSLVPVASGLTGSNGSLSTSFRVPTGFGFSHTVVVAAGATHLQQAVFNVSMGMSMSPRSGPLGTPITIKLTGIGAQPLFDTYRLLYDDHQVGFLSAVSTHGTATVTIPATGPVGTHTLNIIEGASIAPYLNISQSPVPYIPQFNSTFTLTKGSPVLPRPAAAQTLAPVAAKEPDVATTGPALSINPVRARVGTPLTLSGAHFEPGQHVAITWFSHGGSHVKASGVFETHKTLATATTSQNGSFKLTLPAPHDFEGNHLIQALSASAKTTTTFAIIPAIGPLTRSTGPAGTWFTIHVTGTGWTNNSNIYTVDYDNTYVGFACGVNSHGDMTIRLQATGAPGWHLINLYPGIYRGTDEKYTNIFATPQLNLADHPEEHMPTFELAFKIT